MNLTEYNAMPEGDLKLAVRLAITMGWLPENTSFIKSWCGNYIEVRQKIGDCVNYHTFDPFTDASIPYGLIGRGVQSVGLNLYSRFVATQEYVQRTSESKTHAILNAYCAADPLGHWNNFLKGS